MRVFKSKGLLSFSLYWWTILQKKKSISHWPTSYVLSARSEKTNIVHGHGDKNGKMSMIRALKSKGLLTFAAVLKDKLAKWNPFPLTSLPLRVLVVVAINLKKKKTRAIKSNSRTSSLLSLFWKTSFQKKKYSHWLTSLPLPARKLHVRVREIFFCGGGKKINGRKDEGIKIQGSPSLIVSILYYYVRIKKNTFLIDQFSTSCPHVKSRQILFAGGDKFYLKSRDISLLVLILLFRPGTADLGNGNSIKLYNGVSRTAVIWVQTFSF